ncbi:MAG: hypothetical protein AAF702_26545, partial [Chloroflexota bacterium]
GLAKSEALMAAILGVMFFGSALSLLGWVGVFIGAIAVLLLSGIANVKHFNLGTALLGLACGTSFALSSSWIREASLNSGLTFPHSAAWVLVLIISLQTLMLCVYIAFKERDTFKKMWHHKGTTTAVSFCSCLGSIGWFSAMSLQHVARIVTLLPFRNSLMLPNTIFGITMPRLTLSAGGVNATCVSLFSGHSSP